MYIYLHIIKYNTTNMSINLREIQNNEDAKNVDKTLLTLVTFFIS